MGSNVRARGDNAGDPPDTEELADRAVFERDGSLGKLNEPPDLGFVLLLEEDPNMFPTCAMDGSPFGSSFLNASAPPDKDRVRELLLLKTPASDD